MQVINGELHIEIDGQSEIIELSFDEKLKVKLGYIHFYDFDEKKFITETPEGIDFDEQKNKYINSEIEKIKESFDEKISNFLSKYPQREQDAFAQKRIEAQRVIDGGESSYISGKAEFFGITEMQFAEKIIEKAEGFIKLYTGLENQKDAEIGKLQALKTI